MKLYMNFSHIQKLSLKEPKTIFQRMVKLQEECGELALEVLIDNKASGSQHKVAGKDGIKGECVDVMLVVLSIYFSQGGSIEELSAIAEKKSNKWEQHQNKI